MYKIHGFICLYILYHLIWEDKLRWKKGQQLLADDYGIIYLCKKSWSGPHLLLGAHNNFFVKPFLHVFIHNILVPKSVNLVPHVLPTTDTPWAGWSRITWNALWDCNHSWTAAFSRSFILLSKSLETKAST